jgi:hypothetical protein
LINEHTFLNNRSTIYNNGSIDNGGMLFLSGNIENDGIVNNNGSLINSSWIENNGTFTNFSWVDNDSGFVNNGILFNNLTGNISNSGQGSIYNNNIIFNKGSIENGFYGKIVNSGTIYNDGYLLNTYYSVINNYGTISGTGTYTHKIATGTDELSINSGNIIQKSVNIDTGLFVNDGVITISDQICNYGILSGKGLINGNVFNDGQLLPGSSVGSMNIDGNYTQYNEGIIEIDISGNDNTFNYDSLNIIGTARIDGVLNINFLNNDISPTLGNTFKILTATDGILGVFDSYQMSSNSDCWKLIYNATDISLQYIGDGNQSPVPVPSTILLLGSAIAGLAAAGRRKSN